MSAKPAKIRLRDGKVISMHLVREGDRVFANSSVRVGSVHCTVTSITEKDGKKTIHFTEVGGRPGCFSGNNRQKEITSLSLYPDRQIRRKRRSK